MVSFPLEASVQRKPHVPSAGCWNNPPVSVAAGPGAAAGCEAAEPSLDGAQGAARRAAPAPGLRRARGGQEPPPPAAATAQLPAAAKELRLRSDGWEGTASGINTGASCSFQV